MVCMTTNGKLHSVHRCLVIIIKQLCLLSSNYSEGFHIVLHFMFTEDYNNSNQCGESFT